jgi:signal transduction histidine kinase
MTRRILATILAVTTFGIALFGIPLAIGVRRLYENEAVLKLEREAAEAGIAVPASFSRTGDPVELPRPGGGVGLGIYGPNGDKLEGDGPAHADAAVSAALAGDVRSGRRSGALVVAVPVTSEEAVVAAIRATVSERSVDGRVHRAWLAMAALAAGALAGAGLLAWRQSRRLSRPVAALAENAARLGEGDFSVRAPRCGVAELDAAAGALNATAGRLGELVARERAFSADASHQLRTPLTRLRLGLESALATPGADHADVIGAALGDIDRLEATVEELLALARDVAPRRERLDLPALLADVERRWHGPLAAAGRPLRLAVEPGLPEVEASGTALRHILDVLLENAAEHGAGTVTVTARPTAGALAVDVADEGPGPPASEGDLFRRRSPTAEGVGLVLSRPGPGPCFTVLLPAAGSAGRPGSAG